MQSRWVLPAATLLAILLPQGAARAQATAPAVHASAPSAAPTPRVRGIVRLVGEHGGDKVAELEYEDGSTPDVIAGGGVGLAVGVAVELARFGRQALDVQAALGAKYRTIPPATNQELRWLRFPAEALLFYRAPNGVRVGGGAVVHLRNRITANGEVVNDRVSFRNTPGFVVQAEYARQNVGVDLRYTALEYHPSDDRAGSLNASSVGLGFTFYLSPRAAR